MCVVRIRRAVGRAGRRAQPVGLEHDLEVARSLEVVAARNAPADCVGRHLAGEQLLASVDAGNVRGGAGGGSGHAPDFGGVEALLRDERVIQIGGGAGGGNQPLALAVLRGKGGGDRPEQLFGLQPASGELSFLQNFRNRRHAVVGRQDHDRAVEPDLRLDARQEFAERPVGPDGHVADFGAVGPVGVAHRVVRREADAEEVGDAALAEPLVLDRGDCQVLQHLVAKRAAVDGVVQLRPGLAGILRPSAGAEKLPLAPCVRVGRCFLVELLHPRMGRGPVVRAGDEGAGLGVQPVGGVGAMADRQNRRPVLERQAEDLWRALGRQMAAAFFISSPSVVTSSRRGERPGPRPRPAAFRVRDAGHAGTERAVVPVVADDAAQRRRRAGEHRRMPDGRDGGIVSRYACVKVAPRVSSCARPPVNSLRNRVR